MRALPVPRYRVARRERSGSATWRSPMPKIAAGRHTATRSPCPRAPSTACWPGTSQKGGAVTPRRCGGEGERGEPGASAVSQERAEEVGRAPHLSELLGGAVGADVDLWVRSRLVGGPRLPVVAAEGHGGRAREDQPRHPGLARCGHHSASALHVHVEQPVSQVVSDCARRSAAPGPREAAHFASEITTDGVTPAAWNTDSTPSMARFRWAALQTFPSRRRASALVLAGGVRRQRRDTPRT